MVLKNSITTYDTHTAMETLLSTTLNVWVNPHQNPLIAHYRRTKQIKETFIESPPNPFRSPKGFSRPGDEGNNCRNCGDNYLGKGDGIG